MDYTTREVSKRLKDAGFQGESNKIYSIFGKLINDRAEIAEDWRIPAYSASTLLDSLKDYRYSNEPEYRWEIHEDGIFIFHVLRRKAVVAFKVKGSWPDMLAEAIIWILKRNSES